MLVRMNDSFFGEYEIIILYLYEGEFVRGIIECFVYVLKCCLNL